MPRRSIIADNDDATEINLSPMIDCIFILLIFFIVTTVFVEEAGVQINKPDAAEAPPPDDEVETVVFEITAENKILYEGNTIGIKSVSAQVRQKLSRDDVPVSIRSHEKANHGMFLNVWDQVQLAGATKISFTTFN